MILYDIILILFVAVEMPDLWCLSKMCFKKKWSLSSVWLSSLSRLSSYEPFWDLWFYCCYQDVCWKAKLSQYQSGHMRALLELVTVCMDVRRPYPLANYPLFNSKINMINDQVEQASVTNPFQRLRMFSFSIASLYWIASCSGVCCGRIMLNQILKGYTWLYRLKVRWVVIESTPALQRWNWMNSDKT